MQVLHPYFAITCSLNNERSMCLHSRQSRKTQHRTAVGVCCFHPLLCQSWAFLDCSSEFWGGEQFTFRLVYAAYNMATKKQAFLHEIIVIARTPRLIHTVTRYRNGRFQLIPMHPAGLSAGFRYYYGVVIHVNSHGRDEKSNWPILDSYGTYLSDHLILQYASHLNFKTVCVLYCIFKTVVRYMTGYCDLRTYDMAEK